MTRIAITCLMWTCVLGCTRTTKHGDAHLIYHSGTLSAAPSYTLKLPPVSLNERHSQRFQIRNLPVPLYAESWEFPASDAETALTHPLPFGSTTWADAFVEIVICKPDGTKLYGIEHRLGNVSNVTSFYDWGVWRRGGGFFHQGDGHEALPDLTSYDVVISVRQPVQSARPMVLTGSKLKSFVGRQRTRGRESLIQLTGSSKTPDPFDLTIRRAYFRECNIITDR